MTDLTHAPQRPAIKRGLRRAWRDTTTLQLGVGSPHAVVVHDVDVATRTFLDRLDGTVARDDLDVLADESGLARESARGLVRELATHDLLDDAAADARSLRALGPAERDRIAPDLAAWGLAVAGPGGAAGTHRRRRASSVEVHGAGRVGALAAALLAHAGVGTLDVCDPEPLRAGDVPAAWARSAPPDASAPPSRQDLALDVCEQLAPSLRTGRRGAPGAAPRRPAARSGPTGSRASANERADGPTVVLLAPVDAAGAVDLDLRERLVRESVPHVPAYVRETVGVVGPFVVPGRTPCLRCLDLARAERDPSWPRVLAQLCPPPAASRRRSGAGPDAGDGVLAVLVAAQAVLQVLTFLDGGEPSAAGRTLETVLGDGLTRWRPWEAHPACGCHWS